MSDPTASDDEFRSALSGLRIQAEAHGLDINDQNVHAFILHQSEVNASQAAQLRTARNMLHNIG